VRGVDAVGKTKFLRALGLPQNFVPASLKRIVLGQTDSEECEGKLKLQRNPYMPPSPLKYPSYDNE